jgi:5-methylthioribose kinase
MFLLNIQEIKVLDAYLKEKEWLAADEIIIALNRAGEGNMNYVIRVETEKRNIIIKQSRDYVEKYPQIAAPKKRVTTEGLFYKQISAYPAIRQMMPGLIATDEENDIILLEDLGNQSDFTFLYEISEKINEKDIPLLTGYLNELHSTGFNSSVAQKLANREMRLLNHEHIFKFPFGENNGFDLDAISYGLQDIAVPYKNDTFLKKRLYYLGQLYLSDDRYLLHGDFYPGSWLKTGAGIKIIDTEFCFYGPREFDLGIMLAHFYITKHDEYILHQVKKSYTLFNELNSKIVDGFTGVEIMRRLIGIAQLPLKLTLSEKKEMLIKAYQLILH